MNNSFSSMCKLQTLFFLWIFIGFVGDSLAITSDVASQYLIGLKTKDRGNLIAQAQNPPNAWRGLVPLQSTRTEVEKLLGKPISFRGSIVVYKTDQEEVAVVYSAGKCVRSSSEKWNVSAGVIITIEIRPNKPVLIEDLHLDSNKFRRVQLAHPENWFVYRNEEEGVMVETLQYEHKEQVVVLTYFPGIKAKELRCPSNPKRIASKSKLRPCANPSTTTWPQPAQIAPAPKTNS